MFKQFLDRKAAAVNSTGEKLRVMRTDNGGKFTSKEFENYLKKGIKHELTAENPRAEWSYKDKSNSRNSSLHVGRGETSTQILGRSCVTAIYLRNRSPTAAVKGMKPYKSVTREKTVVDILRVFGCE